MEAAVQSIHQPNPVFFKKSANSLKTHRNPHRVSADFLNSTVIQWCPLSHLPTPYLVFLARMVAIDVIGYGISESSPVFIICLQQDSFQDWTVYREYSKFIELDNELRAIYPDIIALPVENIEVDNTTT